jgi:hypothetical protein
MHLGKGEWVNLEHLRISMNFSFYLGRNMIDLDGYGAVMTGNWKGLNELAVSSRGWRTAI